VYVPRPLPPPGFIPPCLPIPSGRCKSGPEWVHKIKHDGYRLIVRRTGDRVRLYTRRGYIWTDRYPRIVEALRSVPVRSVTIDGEAVVCGKDGRSDFDRLHSRGHDAAVLLGAHRGRQRDRLRARLQARASPASLSSGNEVPHIFTRKSRVQPKEILITSAKRLLQQNRQHTDREDGVR
jgi:hypothetical protein